MAGKVSFNVGVAIKNMGYLLELDGRLRDLTPVFEAFIPKWARFNEDKFGEGIGRESEGAQVDDLVFWEPLKASTRKKKRREGRPDAIMVETGDLKRALSDPDLMFQRIEPQDAAFGSPLNPEEAKKVRFNWEKRQTIFLNRADENTIKMLLQRYFQKGEGFEKAYFAKGVENVNLRREIAGMDAAFQSDVSDKDFN